MARRQKGVRHDWNKAPPPPTHCFGCQQPFDGKPVCYDSRYPVMVEVFRSDGTSYFVEHVAGFHEWCRSARRYAMFIATTWQYRARPTP